MSDDKPQSGSTIDELKALRDEIRVKIHLAEMNARDFWSEIEPKLADLENKIERGGDKAAKVANIFLDEVTSAFRRVRDRIEGSPEASADKPTDKP